MAANQYLITLSTTEPLSTSATPVDLAHRPHKWLRRFSAFLEGWAGGMIPKGTSIDIQDGNSTTLAPATGTLTLSSASGSVGGTIGGTSVTVTASGGDTATATALAAAINANSTVNQFVVATSAAGVVTLTALYGNTLGGGAIGNLVTLVAVGTGVTRSAATLTGGANATANKITW